MEFNIFYRKPLKKILSGLYIYISLAIFAITNVNDLKADVLFQASKDAPPSPKVLQYFDNPSFARHIEPKNNFECSEGFSHTLKEFRGNFVILYFWATWCNNCVQRLSQLYELEQELEYLNITDVKILPISIDFKDIENIRQNLIANKMQDPVFFRDPHKELMSALGVSNLPTAIFIDKQGYVINKFSGDLDWKNKFVIEKIKAIKDPSVPVAAQNNDTALQKIDEHSGASDIIIEQPKPTIIN